MAVKEVDIINKFLTQWKNQIIENRKKAGQTTTGKTDSLFEIIMTDTGGSLMAWKYIMVAETGRKPGKVPLGFAQMIMEWAQAKGLDVDRSFGYFVAKKTREKGSKLYRDGGRKDIISNVLTEQNIETLIEEISTYKFTEIYNMLRDGTNTN